MCYTVFVYRNYLKLYIVIDGVALVVVSPDDNSIIMVYLSGVLIR